MTRRAGITEIAKLARQRNWAHKCIKGCAACLRQIAQPFGVDTYWIEDGLRELQYKIDQAYTAKYAEEMRRRQGNE